MAKIKKTVNLAALIEQKNWLSDHINELNRKIRFNIHSSEKELDQFNVDVIEELKSQYSEDLIAIKQKIARTNMKKLRGDSNPIDYYIYLRSELVRDLNFYGKVLKRVKDKGETFTETIANTVVKFVSRFKKNNVISKQTELAKQIQEIDEKLNKFNTRTKVVIELNADFE